MVSTCTLTVLSMRDTGKRTNNTEKARRPGPTARSTKETTWKERKTAMGTSNGQTDPPTMDSSQTTTFMVRESTSGQTSVNTKDNGRTIRCTALGSFHGLMAANIQVIITMIRNRAMVFSPGLTVVSTTVNGSTENNMVKAPISPLRVRPSVVNGKKERE